MNALILEALKRKMNVVSDYPPTNKSRATLYMEESLQVSDAYLYKLEAMGVVSKVACPSDELTYWTLIQE